MPSVSIVVPVYNVEKYLEECLDSLISQTMKDIEIILVDDGSTDSSGVICDRYAQDDRRVYAYHKVNNGQSSARNYGVERANGEYILFVDSDDYINPETCEVLYCAAVENGVEIVHGDTLNDKENLNDRTFRKMASENKVVSGTDFLIDSLKAETYDIVPWLNLIRLAFIQETGLRFKEGYFFEDQLYNLQMLTLKPSVRVLKIRFPFYFYRMDRQGSTTNQINIRKVTDSAYIVWSMYEYCCRNDRINRAEMQAVLMISLFQYVRIWMMASNKVRNDEEVKIDPKCFSYAMEQDQYYPELKDYLKKYVSHRLMMTVVHDVKRLIRRIRGK